MAERYSFPEDRFLLLGTVTKAQGLGGEISVHVPSGQPANLQRYPAFTLIDRHGELSPRLEVRSFRLHKSRVILGLDRVTDRSMAERLVGMGVLLDKADLPRTTEEEFYWHELEGVAVRTRDGQHLGHLRGQFSNGAHEIMVIGDASGEYLVPAVPGIIIAHSTTELVIDPPPGLLAINREAKTGEE